MKVQLLALSAGLQHDENEEALSALRTCVNPAGAVTHGSSAFVTGASSLAVVFPELVKFLPSFCSTATFQAST